MPPQESVSRRLAPGQVIKLALYFVGLVLFSWAARKTFSQVDLEYWSGFKKFSELVNETANVTAKRDDMVVALYSMALSLLGLIPIGWVYTITKEEEGYDQSLVQTLIVLGLTVCGVMLMLEDSLARAFGFLGVVGAVRYRNTLKDPKDAVYVFAALGIGMGCGLRVFHVAALLSMVLCAVFLVMWKLKTGQAIAGSGGSDAGAKEEKKKKKKKKGSDLESMLALLSDESRQAVKADLEAKRGDAPDSTR